MLESTHRRTVTDEQINRRCHDRRFHRLHHRRKRSELNHSFTVCIEDTAKSVVSGAVEYVRERYRREGLAAPSAVIEHGRKPGAVVDSMLFGPRAGE